MADGKSLIVDTSRCTACRGCQVACKQWRGQPGGQTRQTGTYQNPPDLSADTWKVVRFSEGRGPDGKPFWRFFSDMCRHCLAPGCMEAGDNDEIVIDGPSGAVIHTAATKWLDFHKIHAGCPYDIPRRDAKTKASKKCDMCLDRLRANMIPACALACPTGAIQFGERAEVLQKVKDRVAQLQKDYPQAKALNADDVRVIFIVTASPETYHAYAEA